MSNPSDRLGDPGSRLGVPTRRDLSETQAVLWTVVIVATAFDVVTTIVGVGRGLEEGNAVARAFIVTYGPTGVGWLKFGALLALVLVWGRLPDRLATVGLAGFAVVSLLVVAANSVALLGL